MFRARLFTQLNLRGLQQTAEDPGDRAPINKHCLYVELGPFEGNAQIEIIGDSIREFILLLNLLQGWLKVDHVALSSFS